MTLALPKRLQRASHGVQAASLAVLFLAFAFGGAARAGEADVADALSRAGLLLEANEHAKIVALLSPYESLQSPEVDRALADALLAVAINTRPAGVGVDAVDASHALRLAERAAEKGHGPALSLLYSMYGNGWGVPADAARARDYLERAVAVGDPSARLNQAIGWYEGSAVLPRDRAKACEALFAIGKERGPDPILAYYLGLATYRGECGMDADPKAGVKMIAIAARHGLRQAQADMGRSFEFGWVGGKDLAQALDWYGQAAENGDGHSLWRMGISYVRGEGRDKDAGKAVDYFRRSAETGDGSGLSSLAVMYATGDGVGRDYAEAFSLYERAAKAGTPHGYRGMAVMYFNGEGMPADPVRAWVLYSQGVESGNEPDDKMRREFESEMSFDEIQRAKAEFQAWRAGHGDDGQR